MTGGMDDAEATAEMADYTRLCAIWDKRAATAREAWRKMKKGEAA
jgi:hypothetical protein